MAITAFCERPQTPEWFAVYVVSKHEKRVAEHFHVRQIEHYLPLYSESRTWKDGSKVRLQLPLFPGYLFVRTVRNRRNRVFEAPGVLSIVAQHDSAIIPDSYIHVLREGLHLRKIEPHPYLTIGNRVRIKSGALAGMEGVLVRKKTAFRVVLTVDVMMRSVAIEVGREEIEPVKRSPSL